MKEVPLTHGQVALVDDEDFEMVNAHRWIAMWDSTTQQWYAKTSRKTAIPGTRYMHRAIAGAREGEQVDHRNNVKLDNRRANLRICTRSKNSANKTKWKRPCLSEFKGVTRDRTSWVAKFYCTGTRRYVQKFENEVEAAHAYDDVARRVHGEFACLNFPGPGERSALTGEIIPQLKESAA